MTKFGDESQFLDHWPILICALKHANFKIFEKIFEYKGFKCKLVRLLFADIVFFRRKNHPICTRASVSEGSFSVSLKSRSTEKHEVIGPKAICI